MPDKMPARNAQLLTVYELYRGETTVLLNFAGEIAKLLQMTSRLSGAFIAYCPDGVTGINRRGRLYSSSADKLCHANRPHLSITGRLAARFARQRGPILLTDLCKNLHDIGKHLEDFGRE